MFEIKIKCKCHTLGAKMPGIAEIRAKMLTTLLLYLAIAFIIIFALMLYFPVPYYYSVVVAVLVFIFVWLFSPSIIIAATKLRYISTDEYPQLQETIEELARAAKVRKPLVAIVPAMEPNLFVFGRSGGSATLVIHEGTLTALGTDELKAAVTHEMAHIKSGDFAVLTMVSFIPMLFYMAARKSLWVSFFDDKKANSPISVLLGILAFVIYFISVILLLPLSYSREEYADAFFVDKSKKPEDLAVALYKISYANFKMQNGSRSGTSARHFYIIDFFNVDRDMRSLKNHYAELKRAVPYMDIATVLKVQAHSRNGLLGMLNSMFFTHPPTYKRIMGILAEEDKRKS